MAQNHLADLSAEELSRADKRQITRNLTADLVALGALLAAFAYERIFPARTAVAAAIYLVGILIEWIPMLVSAIKGFLSKNMDHAMEILVAIAVVACFLDGQFALAILVPLILNIVHFFEERSVMGGRDVIDGLKKMQSDTAILYDPESKEEKEISAKELSVGQLILIKPGCAIPVDGEIVQGDSAIDQKSLTGEPVPATVSVGDKVFAGTYNIDGVLTVRVEKEYNDTSFSKILNLLQESERIQIPEARIVDRFMYYYIPLVLAIAAAVALATSDISKAISILVVSCPCGHMLISSAPMIAALAVSTKRGILIKNSKFVEQLCDVETVVFDKTGTVTEGDLAVADVEACGAEGEENVSRMLGVIGSISSGSLHPASKAVVALCRERGIEFPQAEDIKEHIGRGMEGKLPAGTVLYGSRHFMQEQGITLPEVFENEPQVHTGPVNYVALNGVLLGRISFVDRLRPEAPESIEALRAEGVKKTVMLTGDKSEAAERIRAEAGIDEAFAGLLPEDKLERVKAIRAEGGTVVVGDGINDALALKEADVGIAMGAMGSDTAIQSADIALMNNNLRNIPFAVKLAKKTRGTMYQNIAIAFASSAVMMLLSGFGVITALAGAFLHNIGAFIILINSARLTKLE
ncbi:MAG: cation-translocating P-type ATPase [Ruminococcaceae bacterium]|nr:cation-translocating P-type ATPase [Oscillospiraceae bacterium]